MRIERRHLEVVLAVAEAGSISRAALELRVAQPALTAQLKRIEQALGGPLFERGAAGVAPTELGREVIARARGLLEQFEDLYRATQAVAARRLARPVRVAGVAGGLMPLLIDALAARFPDRRLIRHDGLPVAAMTASLASGETDIAVLHEFPGHPVDLPSSVQGVTALAFEPVFVAVPSAHRLAGRGQVDLAELAGEDWVMPLPDEDGLFEAFQTACRQAGFDPQVRSYTMDRLRVKEAVEEGCVSGTYPTAAMWTDEEILSLRGSPLRRRLLLAWSRASPLAEFAPALLGGLLAGYEAVVLSRPQFASWWREHGRNAVHGPAPAAVRTGGV